MSFPAAQGLDPGQPGFTWHLLAPKPAVTISMKQMPWPNRLLQS
jgi:hypothetical protein